MGIISILLIAVGLAMDSLAVSISGGIVMRPFCMRQSLRLAFTMGIFQGLNRLVFLADSVHEIQDGLWLRWSIP